MTPLPAASAANPPRRTTLGVQEHDIAGRALVAQPVDGLAIPPARA